MCMCVLMCVCLRMFSGIGVYLCICAFVCVCVCRQIDTDMYIYHMNTLESILLRMMTYVPAPEFGEKRNIREGKVDAATPK